MFGIGMPEMILIMAVALIVIGPKKLPELAKSLGKALGEFKKATHELKESIAIDDEIADAKSTFQDLTHDITSAGADDASDEDIEEPVLTQHPPSESKDEEEQPDQDTKPGETEEPSKDV
jgi:sec-independent protein translocase protein TatB